MHDERDRPAHGGHDGRHKRKHRDQAEVERRRFAKSLARSEFGRHYVDDRDQDEVRASLARPRNRPHGQ